MQRSNLADALFKPRRIALVGASANYAKATSRAQRYLLQHGYGGEIYPINPNRDEILGLTSYPSLSDAPQPIDHAFIMLGQEAVFQAVRDCVTLGIPCATILAGGFAESGQAGRERQTKLLKIARAGGLRILGPNSIGMINVSDKITLSANAMLDLPDLTTGGVSVVSQSGSLIGALLSHGVAHGTGFSKLISVGNEADLGVGEIADMLIDDPKTRVIILFLETMRDHEMLAAMARRAFAAGKPVITYKLGRSDIGQELAVSHTGAIAGSDQAFDAYVRHHGIARVRNFEALIESPNLFKGSKPSNGNRVGIASTTGGGGAMVVDCLAETGIEIAAPGKAVSARLQAAGVPYDGSKLVDLTIAGASAETVNGVIGDLMDNPDCDAVVMVVGSSARFHPELAVEPLIRWANGPKPLAVYLAPDSQESLRLLGRAGIATFRTPEACAEGVHAFLNWRKPCLDGICEADRVARARALVNHAPGNVLGEAAALNIFDSLGLPVPGGISVSDADSAVQAAEKLSYPVVLKIQSDDIAHKTEVGGVFLNLCTAQDVRKACEDILRNVTEMHPNAAIKGLLVQPMQTGIGEALLGYKRDPMVGPIVVLGSGGVLAEIFRDSAIRLAPVTRNQARAMVNEVRGLAPIRGYRGLPEGDVDALVDAIVNMSALAEIDSIHEAEVNPVLIRKKGHGVIAVDGLIIRAQSTEYHE